MAKDLSGSTSQTGQSIRAQIEKENNMKFMAVKILFILLAAFVAVKSGIGIYGHYTEVQRLSLQIEQEQQSFDALKAEAEEWHKENDRAITDFDDESGKVVSEITLPSALNAGNEIADLQDRLYANGLLTVEDEARLRTLTKGTYGFTESSTSAWFTGIGRYQLDPAQTELDWRFNTWYDATPDANGIVPSQYDCVWTCWHKAASGSEYLVAVMFGSYIADSGSFNVFARYVSNFGEMLAQNGSIEAVDDETDEFTDIDQMIGELTGEGSGGTGTEGDPEEGEGVSGEVQEWGVEDSGASDGNAGGTTDTEPDPEDQSGGTHGA